MRMVCDALHHCGKLLQIDSHAQHAFNVTISGGIKHGLQGIITSGQVQPVQMTMGIYKHEMKKMDLHSVGTAAGIEQRRNIGFDLTDQGSIFL